MSMGFFTDDLRGAEGKQECPKCWKRAVSTDDDGTSACAKCGWTNGGGGKQDGWFDKSW